MKALISNSLALRLAAAGLLIGCLAMLGSMAAAQERVISEIDPAVVQQGDTVLLTIRGENLPVGTVALDFFPQQIAVLDILSASDTEVVAQIKVPSLVAPGAYNVVLYNHLGDEAFGEGLLTIATDVITPIFRDYDPKVIAEATEGFALLLSGESVTDEAAGHLRMRWYQGERELTRLSTMFSAGGPGQVVCAVTGDLPAGKLQGKVYLDDKPIYLVEITIQSPTGIIVGHSPAQLDLAAAPYQLNLIGTDLTQDYVSLLNVELASADTSAKAQEVTLRDASTLSVQFNGPLPAGEYELRVVRLDDVVYSGQVELASTPAPPDVEPEAPAPPEVEVPAIGEPPSGGSAEPPRQPPVELRIDSVAPLSIPASAKAASLVINGTGLGASVAERLQVRLTFNQADCELLFMGAGRQNLTCLFAPPDGGWPAGGSGTLTITDPDGVLGEFTAQLKVGSALPAAQTLLEGSADLEAPAPRIPQVPAATGAPVAWQADEADVVYRNGTETLTVGLMANGQGWNPQLLSGSFNLLPDDPLLPQVFSNVTVAGELAFVRVDDLKAEASCPGHFVPGDLLVELRYAEGTESASMLRLAVPKPEGIAVAPDRAEVEVDAVSGRMSPETLDWKVDFSPLVIKQPDLVSLEFSPPPADSEEAVSLQFKDAQLHIELHPAAWRILVEPGHTITAQLKTTLQLELAGDTAMEIHLVGGAARTPAEIRLAGNEINITKAGFEIGLLVGDPELTAEMLANVRLDSSNLLLALNASEFTVEAEAAEELGQGGIVLRFIRSAETLPDVSYGLLMEELLDADNVEVLLSWPDLDQQLSTTLRFTRPATEEANSEAAAVMSSDQH